jgi:hypothetical protein
MDTLKDKACIVGVGESAFTRGSGKTELRLNQRKKKKEYKDDTTAGLAVCTRVARS